MNLVIDIGNTRAKMAVFEDGKILSYAAFEDFGIDDIREMTGDVSDVFCILSAVKKTDPAILEFLRSRFHLLVLNHKTPIPIKNHYDTPRTLGKDRIAAAVAAGRMLPGRNILVIDAGTAITYDLVLSGNVFSGGGISPGITMRFMALKKFTGNLPLISDISIAPLTGKNTPDSIRSGVLQGVVCEMEGIIRLYRLKYPDIEVILTGGNHYFFDKQLKIKTFAVPNLVLEGLNIILDYNIAKNNLL